MVNDAAKKSIPKTSGKGRRRSPPWWSGKCWIAVKKRKAAFRRFERVASPYNYTRFSKARAVVKRVIKASKKESWEDFINSISSKSNSRDVWRKTKMLNNKHHSELVNTLKLNQQKVENWFRKKQTNTTKLYF